MMMLENSAKITGDIQNKRWNNGMILVGEGISTLDLAKSIRMRTKHISSSEVVVYSDSKTLLREYHKKAMKESDMTSKAGTIITAM